MLTTVGSSLPARSAKESGAGLAQAGSYFFDAFAFDGNAGHYFESELIGQSIGVDFYAALQGIIPLVDDDKHTLAHFDQLHSKE